MKKAFTDSLLDTTWPLLSAGFLRPWRTCSQLTQLFWTANGS